MMHAKSWAVALSMACFATGSVAQECCKSSEGSTASAAAAAVPASLQEKPFLGVYLGDADAAGQGVGITGVVPGSAAERSGFQAGDRILSLDGEELHGVDELVELLGNHSVGDKVRVVFVRDGEKMNTSVRLGAAPSEDAEEMEEIEEVEPEATEAPETTEGERGWLGVEISEGDDGVEIMNVRPGSPADKAGLEAHDVLQRLNDESVSDMDSLLEVLTDLGPGTKASLTFTRDGETHKTKVKLGSMADAEMTEGAPMAPQIAERQARAEETRARTEETRARTEELRQRARERGGEIADQVRRAREERRGEGADADQMQDLRQGMDGLREEMNSLREENDRLRRDNEKLRRALNDVEKLLQRIDDRSSDRTSILDDDAGKPAPAGLAGGHGGAHGAGGGLGHAVGGGALAGPLRVITAGDDEDDGDTPHAKVFRFQVGKDGGEGQQDIEVRVNSNGKWHELKLPGGMHGLNLEKVEGLPGGKHILWSSDENGEGKVHVYVIGDEDGDVDVQCEDCDDCGDEGCCDDVDADAQVFVVPGPHGLGVRGAPAPAAMPRVRMAPPSVNVPALNARMLRVPQVQVTAPRVRFAVPQPPVPPTPPMPPAPARRSACCCPCMPAVPAAAPQGCCTMVCPTPATAPTCVVEPVECELPAGAFILELEGSGAPECAIELQCVPAVEVQCTPAVEVQCQAPSCTATEIN